MYFYYYYIRYYYYSPFFAANFTTESVIKIPLQNILKKMNFEVLI